MPSEQREEARLRLARVGIDDVAGYLQGASRHGRTRDFAWNSCRSSSCRRCMIVCSSAGAAAGAVRRLLNLSARYLPMRGGDGRTNCFAASGCVSESRERLVV